MNSSRWAGAVGLALLASTVLGSGVANAEPGGTKPPEVSAVERTATLVRPAVVRLQMKLPIRITDPTGTLLTAPVADNDFGGTCTGFGVNPDGYVATAGHCVDTTTTDGLVGSAIRLVAQQVVAADPTKSLDQVLRFAVQNWRVSSPTGTPLELQAQVTVGSLDNGHKPVTSPATIVGYRPPAEGDVALLKIDVKDLPTLPLATDADVHIGTDVLAVGFPGSADSTTDVSLEPSNKDGRISSKKTVKGVPFYETSAAMAHGMSGGPVVDMRGRLVGVTSWGAEETAAINFMATSDTLATFLTSKNVVPAAGQFDTNFRAGLDAYYAGRYSEAIADLDKVLAAAPGQAQAEELRAQAVEGKTKYGEPLPAPPAPAKLFGLDPVLFWVLVGAGGALLLIVLALVIAKVRRGRRRRAAERTWSDGPAMAQLPSMGAPSYPPPFPQQRSFGPPPFPPPATRSFPPPYAPWAPAPINNSTVGAPMGTATLQAPVSCRHCPAALPPGAGFCRACGRSQHGPSGGAL
jgi:S1-C subfamily serine protease